MCAIANRYTVHERATVWMCAPMKVPLLLPSSHLFPALIPGGWRAAAGAMLPQEVQCNEPCGLSGQGVLRPRTAPAGTGTVHKLRKRTVVGGVDQESVHSKGNLISALRNLISALIECTVMHF